MSADDAVVARALADLKSAGGAILIDLEFTCWEDSLRTQWADPARPAEVIEIGLAAWDVRTGAAGASFSALVRPRVNPTLSAYCLDLLHIPQGEIDAADGLPVALGHVVTWLRALPGQRVPTCSWGTIDRVGLAANARSLGVPDPFDARPHIDLCAVMTALHRHPTPIDRDDLRALARLPAKPRRHRALDDALDLVHFLALLLASR